MIMDNASDHSVQIDKPPTQANKKADLVAWLQRNGIEADIHLLKAELLQLVKENKPAKMRHEIDELAHEHGHTIIRTPSYHCQYNAIELIWAQVKGQYSYYLLLLCKLITYLFNSLCESQLGTKFVLLERPWYSRLI